MNYAIFIILFLMLSVSGCTTTPSINSTNNNSSESGLVIDSVDTISGSIESGKSMILSTGIQDQPDVSSGESISKNNSDKASFASKSEQRDETPIEKLGISIKHPVGYKYEGGVLRNENRGNELNKSDSTLCAQDQNGPRLEISFGNGQDSFRLEAINKNTCLSTTMGDDGVYRDGSDTMSFGENITPTYIVGNNKIRIDLQKCSGPGHPVLTARVLGSFAHALSLVEISFPISKELFDSIAKNTPSGMLACEYISSNELIKASSSQIMILKTIAESLFTQ